MILSKGIRNILVLHAACVGSIFILWVKKHNAILRDKIACHGVIYLDALTHVCASVFAYEKLLPAQQIISPKGCTPVLYNLSSLTCHTITLKTT